MAQYQSAISLASVGIVDNCEVIHVQGTKGSSLDEYSRVEITAPDDSVAILVRRFHQKTAKVFQELQGVKSVTNKASSDASKEVMALLKLSEYQSNIRMNSESKYGEVKDIENMASQTAQIINLFDKLSIESQEKIPLPHEVRQWAVSKMLDCADKWELRFSDVFNVLTNNLGRDLLKEAIRVQQVRDIFGIRAVDEIRKELNIS